MKKRFTVYDSKAEAFLPPTYFGATGEAIRSFEAAANKQEHDFHNYAGDYTLFETGTWDEQTDEHKSLEARINLGTALQYIKNDIARSISQETPTGVTETPDARLNRLYGGKETKPNLNHGFPLNSGDTKR